MGITFKDVAGAQESKEELKDVVDFLKSPEKYARLGAKIPRGVLLCGAPGNGKTLLAKAVAGEANCPFFSISGSDFVEVFVGVGASRVRDLFAQARKNAPCIVFIDEIDAVGRQRGAGMGGGNDEREQTLNQLLAEMDGFATNPRGSVIVLAATNRPDVLDKALMRPGRFDRNVEVPYPDLISRKQILDVHIKNTPLADDVNVERIARGTPGFSGADLENLINEAALAASKADKEVVNTLDFERARDRIMLGAERSTMIITEEDKKLTAYHEGGHALMNLLLPKTDPFHKVTIIPRGRALGVSWSLPERDKHTHTKESMVQRIQVALGGLIAERMVFNEVTSGPASDISTATSIAREMVCTYGMSSLGPISYRGGQHAYLGTGGTSGDYSEDTARRIDEEVEKIMKQCEKEAEKLMKDNRDKLNLLAETLLEKETLHADEVYELLDLEPRTYHSFMPGDNNGEKAAKETSESDDDSGDDENRDFDGKIEPEEA
jgi:cell division protease FtsH